MGSIKGKVALTGKSKLVIAASGKVEGQIVAKSISIEVIANAKIDASGGLVSFGENAICTGSIQYTLGHWRALASAGERWRALAHYLEDRAVAIDNNHLKRQMKP